MRGHSSSLQRAHDHLHTTGIRAVLAADITEGCTEDGSRYCPTDPVIRAQMASSLQRALGEG